jgi:putative transposase
MNPPNSGLKCLMALRTEVSWMCCFSVSTGSLALRKVINSVYPKAQVQRCIIHMLRNSFKYISYKDIKKFASDFKAVYKTPIEELALAELEMLKDKWGKNIHMPSIIWKATGMYSPFFSFSDDIRRIMYTTNIIEKLNRQF